MAGGDTRPGAADRLVTVVIPTDGNFRLVDRCIQALALTEAPAWCDVVVVHTTAQLDSPTRITAHQWLRTAHHPLPLDALRAVSAAVATSGCPFVLLLSPHAEPAPGFLEPLIAHHRAHGDEQRPLAVVPRSRGILVSPDIPGDWPVLLGTPLPAQAVLVDAADWAILTAQASGPTLAADAPATLASLAATTSTATDSWVPSNRPLAVVMALNSVLPRWNAADAPGLVLQAAQGNLGVGIPGMRTWLHVAACNMPEASTALADWRLALDMLPARERDGLSRLMRRRDQLAAEILQEARLSPAAADVACRAIAEGDWIRAVDNLAAHPGSYPAAVAVVTLAARERHPSTPPPEGIPRVVVQGWFDSPIPEDAQALVATWTRHHPAWEHRMFDTEAARDWIRQWLGTEAERTFLGATPVGKSNLFRYAYLSVVGGIWSDTDDRCTACIDPLLDCHTLVMRRESIGAIGDNFIAVAPGHPVLVATRDEAFRNVHDGFGESPWLANGPGVFTRHVAAWLATEGGELDYRIASDYELSAHIAIHQHLDYKETSLAWDVPADPKAELPSYWSRPWDRPQPLSRRQRSLAEQAVEV